jgi:hypothetical protein
VGCIFNSLSVVKYPVYYTSGPTLTIFAITYAVSNYRKKLTFGYGETYIWSYKPAPFIIIIIYATSFCGNWASLIARGARLKHEHSEGFKASRAIRKAQFTQKRVAYKILLLETTSNFSRPVRHVTLNVLSRATIRYLLLFALGQLRGSLQRRKMKIYDS